MEGAPEGQGHLLGAVPGRHERRRATVRALLSELPLTALATHTFPFEEAETAFAALDRGDDDIVHIALSYS